MNKILSRTGVKIHNFTHFYDFLLDFRRFYVHFLIIYRLFIQKVWIRAPTMTLVGSRAGRRDTGEGAAGCAGMVWIYISRHETDNARCETSIARREMTVSSLAKNMKMTAKQKEILLNNVKTTVYRISFSNFVRITIQRELFIRNYCCPVKLLQAK